MTLLFTLIVRLLGIRGETVVDFLIGGRRLLLENVVVVVVDGLGVVIGTLFSSSSSSTCFLVVVLSVTRMGFRGVVEVVMGTGAAAALAADSSPSPPPPPFFVHTLCFLFGSDFCSHGGISFLPSEEEERQA